MPTQCMSNADRDSAADAASHLFFAYLRSLSPDPARGTKGIIGLPISLQQLVQATEYPPEAPTLMFNEATKVVMIVDIVSPTPYALLRRAKNFEYRDDDSALQQFANYDDPIRALTDECRRVLKCISSTNQSTISTSKASTSLRDASWSRFEDVGFGATIEESDGEEDGDQSMLGPIRHSGGLRNQAQSENGYLGRPTTPSWADFLSSGFTDENGTKASSPMLLPPDKILPRIQTGQRGQSSQSHRRDLDTGSTLEPGELASIDKLDVDDSFWWVWISSLAGEEPTSRKAVFGRCALIETVLTGGRWMVMEEQVKGAAPEPAPGAYIAEKKGFFGFTTRRARLAGKKSAQKKSLLSSDVYDKAENFGPQSRTNIAPDQHARIQAAAVELQRRNQNQDRLADGARRGRHDEVSNKTNSVMTLQPLVMTEASHAMKWASQYDKKETRAQYLGVDLAGRGSTSDLLPPPAANGVATNASTISLTEPPKKHELSPPPEKIPLPKSPVPPSSTEIPLSELPTLSRPKEDPLPKTPSPPPPKDSPLPQPPSPPPSNKASQALPPHPSTRAPERRNASSHEPVITALPQPPSPVATPPHSSEPQSAIPRKVVGSSPEQVKLTKKRNAGTGIKGIFGARRTKEPPIKSMASPPMASPPIETSPAIAAARAAIASKNKSQVNGQPVHQVITQASRQAPTPAPNKSQRPVTTPPPEPTYQMSDSPPATSNIPQIGAVQRPAGAPRTRRDSQDGSLSRVDTNEREQADREFSTFDQGPFLEQPAFIPPDSSLPPEPISPVKEEPHQQVPGAFDDVIEEEEEEEEVVDEPTDLTRKMSPVQDRWAQIRKNAAERAARQSEEVKTDDGETSGEESKSQLRSMYRFRH